ncbi:MULTISPECIES: phosphodiester glycosidase family protein [Paenibacillus]|uniref:phosphodiester glycosidase family protein n=1 Tax=Paenibacillus TaxID=44249 RepID=UPI000490A666|nr:phosphodiester glycosidase family protein [Paenibacillus sp. IHBB 10380]
MSKLKYIRPKQVNRLFMLAIAPFIGMLLCMWLLTQPPRITLHSSEYIADNHISEQSAKIRSDLGQAAAAAKQTVSSIEKTAVLYQQTTAKVGSLLGKAKTQAAKPEQIYNRRITSKLGAPIETVHSDRIRIELYKVNPGPYHGYAMKVKLKDPSAMSMSLGSESGKPGTVETTMRAVSRHGAVAGINAGGYADGNKGRFPLGTTFYEGHYVSGFQPSFKDLAFVGMSTSGKLIGGKFYSQQQLDRLSPKFGATFVPVLLQNGRKTTIPEKWRSTPARAPRTVIGNYKDDQLLILVTEGYDENGKSGATLQELQNKLLKLGVIDAYNLDGGGSSSLVLNGRVVNKPSDGQLRPVPTHFLFFK